MMVMVQGEGVGRVVVCGNPRLYGGCPGWVKEVERWCWIGEVGGLIKCYHSGRYRVVRLFGDKGIRVMI